MSGQKGCLCVWGLGLALGIVEALFTFALGMAAWKMNYAPDAVKMIGEFYMGFGPTLEGSLKGAAWGFVTMFIAGVLIAWIYNLVCCMCCSGKECKSK